MSRAAKILKDDSAEVAGLKRRVKDLEQHLESTAESLERTRKSKHKIPVQGKLRTSKGAFVRVFLPDTHGNLVDQDALKAFLTDLAYLNPRELYFMGDHLDCGGFLAQHHTLGYVAETENTFEDDVAAANTMLDAVQKICPKASMRYLQGNHECLDEEHEVLCRDGWKPIADITETDIVAQMGDDGVAVWGTPEAVHKHEYDGEMIEVNAPSWRIRMTPNHRTIYRSQDGKRWLERNAEDLMRLKLSAYMIPMSLRNANTEEVALSDDQLRLAAWIITDGCLSSNRVAIYQSKTEHHEEITNSLEKCGIGYTKTCRQRYVQYLPETAFQAHAEFYPKIERLLGIRRPFRKEQKVLPKWVWKLTRRQFDVFFETMVNADGSRLGECRTLYGEEAFLSEVQRLVVLNGKSCSLRKKTNKTEGNFSSQAHHWCLNITNKTIRKPTLYNNGVMKTSHHKGFVYCLTTGTGNFVVRYKGNVSVTGNSRLETWAITSALRNTKDSAFLLRMMGPESVLHLKQRGIEYIRKSECYDGCRIQGTVKAGKCYVTHGTSHGKNAANVMLNRFNACVVFGHVHKLLSATDRNVKDGEIGAWSVGHLSRQQPLWRHGHPTDWSQGYGFQVCEPNGDFLHINVPIMDGKSYLGSLKQVLT